MLMALISSRVGTAAGVPDDFGCALPDRASAEPVAANDEDSRPVLGAGAVQDSGRARRVAGSVGGMVTAAPVVAVTGANGLVGTAVCRALVERSAQVRAVVRRAGSAHAPEGVTEHGRGRRRCPLSEGSGDYPDTRNATDAVPAQVGGLTTVWSARVPGAMKSRPVRLLRLQRAAPGRARGVAHRRPGVGRGQHAVPRAVGVRHQPGPAGLAYGRRRAPTTWTPYVWHWRACDLVSEGGLEPPRPIKGTSTSS
jgi:hypothetical protein